MLTDEQFQKRKRQLIEEERKKPPGWFYLSFAGDQGFLGGAFVQGQGIVTAIDRSHRLRLNPGNCQVAGLELDADQVAALPADARERLLSKAELERIFGGVERWGNQ